MFPFLRSNENAKPLGDYSCGLMVKTGDGKRYFFPGGEIELAMIVARAALPESDLEHPDTLIEFGDRSGERGELWVSSKRVKASALVPEHATDTV